MAERDRAVKLSFQIVSRAEEERRVMRRSLGGQIEHWASLGAEVEASGLTVDEVKGLLRRKIQTHSKELLGVTEDPLSVFGTQAVSDKVRAYIHGQNQPHIYEDPKSPGKIIKEYRDGQREVVGTENERRSGKKVVAR